MEKKYQILWEHQEYLTRVCIAEQYASSMLHFIPRGLPVFQSHGITHSVAIIGFIHQTIISFPISLSIDEIFLLYLAAWFHDLGYLHPLSIHDRGGHPELSVDMIMRDPVLLDLLSGDELENLTVLVKYHDSHADITKLKKTFPLRISLITALFRLTDSADLGKDRCPIEVFTLIEDGLDEHSRRHWKAHQNIRECIIDYPDLKIVVYDPENPFFRRRIIPHLEDDCRSSGQILKQYGISPLKLVIHTDDGNITDTSSISTEKNVSFAPVSIQRQ